VRIYGQPDARFLCVGYPVLIYYDGLEGMLPLVERIRNLNDEKVDKVILREQGDILSAVGQWREGALFSMGKMGWLQFGPYITLPSGNYHVEWNGKIILSGPEQIGSVDISSNMGANILAHTMVSLESLAAMPKGQLAVLELSLDRDAPFVEFRFYVNEKAMVQLNEVVITRIR
jgi:hypothetical protein